MDHDQEKVKIIEETLRKLGMIETCTWDRTRNELLVKLSQDDATTNPEKAFEKGLKHWESIFQGSYKNQFVNEDGEVPNLFAGWDSTITGQPIPTNEMKEWQDTTIRKILPYKPGRILELGSGSGLIVERLASQDFCTGYLATDLSTNSINFLKSSVPRFGDWGRKLEFEQGDAITVLNKVIGSSKTFDMVIVNSVVQYFPNATYLTTVLEKSVDILNPGGGIFIGDIRNADWVKMHLIKMVIRNLKNKGSAMKWSEIWSALQEHLDKNFELCLGPKYFQDFLSRHPGTAFGMVDLHRGNWTNEMVLYRYNVVLLKNPTFEVPKTIVETRIQWRTDMDLRSVLKALDNKDVIKVQNIPNKRLFVEAGLIRNKLSMSSESVDIDQLIDTLTTQAETESVNPETFAKIGEDLGYHVILSISETNPTWFDAEFYKSEIPIPKSYNYVNVGNEDIPFELSNNPSSNKEKLVAKTVIKIQLNKLLRGSALPSPQIRFV